MPTAPSATPRTIGGRKVLLVCAALVTVLAGIAGWWMVQERPRPGAYLDALALDGDFVVAIREERTSKRAFVELYGEGEGLRWQALVPSYRVGDGAIGVAASERAVTVRFPRDGRTQVFGFSSVSAQKLGTVILGNELAKEPDGHLAEGVATLSAGALSFEILEPDGAPTRVNAVSMTQGQIVWVRDLPGRGVEATWVTPDRLVVEQAGSVSLLARDDGAITTVEADAACVATGVDGDVVVTGRPGELVVTPARGAPVRVALAPGRAFSGLCGLRGDRVIAVVDGADGIRLYTVPVTGPAPDGDAPVVAEGTAATPALARLRVAAAARAPLAGRLDRIEPVLVATAAGARLVAIDVDRGAAVWTGAATAALDDAVLVDAGRTALLRAGELLVAIDPGSGEARAVRIPGTRPLRAHHVAGGTVWVIGDAGLVALDVRTLAPKGSFRRPPPVEAAPAEAITALGLTPAR